MKLTVFNGSPRGSASNTQVLMGRFIEGFLETPGNTAEIVCLRDEKDRARLVRMFEDCDAAMLAFPLYTDTTPAVVKEFIESLQPLCSRPGNPALGYCVISGFPEAVHTQGVQRYLEKLAAMLGCRYIGTITKGNAEGVRWGSEKGNAALFEAFRRFGRDLAQSGSFSETALAEVAGPVKFSKAMAAVFSIVSWLGLSNVGWDKMLKGNNAFEKRYDKPYDKPYA